MEKIRLTWKEVTENSCQVDELLGKVVSIIDLIKEDGVIEQVFFVCKDGTKYLFFHDQDCCEGVRLYDIEGDVSDLIDSPILKAEEVTKECEECDDSGTWTFYKLATQKGYVTFRWLGESNGYYSEAVDFVRLDND